jgi:hypothetical protein
MAEESLSQIQYSEAKFNNWRQCEKTITFAGGTTNAIGDYDGTGNPFDIFTVTGDVIVKVVGICTTNLASSGGTLEVGVDITSNTALIIAQTTASNIDAKNIWHDASPDVSVEASTVFAEKIIANGEDIVGTVGTANITAGVIRFLCFWKPISKNGNVIAA